MSVSAPAKEKAQKTSKIVLIIENKPPRFSRRGTSAIIPSVPCGNMLMLKPSINASSPCFRLKPCNKMPKIMAKTQAISINGITGFLLIAPQSTIIGGKIKTILKL
ncbi:hypothetical protein D3C75_805530 [compost metagenome]